MSADLDRPDDEAMLTGFEWVGDSRDDPEPTRAAEPLPEPRWAPQSKQACQGCGGHVTSQFRKTMGDDNDVAHACRGCVDADDLLKGAAADPDYESRVQYADPMDVPTISSSRGGR